MAFERNAVDYDVTEKNPMILEQINTIPFFNVVNINLFILLLKKRLQIVAFKS